MIYKKCESAIMREEDSEAILFEHGSDGDAKISLLNSTAYVIWSMCDGELLANEIVNSFINKFPNLDKEQITKDIYVFFDKMVARGWLEPV